MSGSTEQSGAAESEIGWEAALTESLTTLSNETEDSSEEDINTDESLQAEGTESEVEDSETEPDSPEPLEPLEQWSDENKEIFSSLDSKAQEFLLTRHKELEGGFTQKTQDLAETRKRYEALDQVLTPYEEVLSQQGQQVAPVVAQALTLLAQVSRDPASAVKEAIRSYNLTPEQLGLAEDDDLTDPTIKAQNERIANLENRITQQNQTSQNETQQQGLAQLSEFETAKGDDGELLHPHFASVRKIMAPLVQDGQSLDDAYSAAVYTVPEYREQQAKADKERSDKDALAKQEAARKDKVKKAKASGTLGASDVESSESGPTAFQGWGDSVAETLTKLNQS